MTKKTIHLIAAARPNFMKIAPLYHALKKAKWAVPEIVHTGQHYDVNMSDAFFKDLMLPEPHHHLGIGSGSHAEQTGRVMMAYERLLAEKKPDLVVVVGDVNSTAACTLSAVKMNSSRPLVAHLEAGLRSFDRTMPEEINRIVTDSIADILWTPSPDGDENLLNEGIPAEKIERVGNIMIDSLEMMRARIEKENAISMYGIEKGNYGLVTLHRPANVDDKQKLQSLCDALVHVSEDLPLVFPVHPRTRKNLEKYDLLKALERASGIYLDEPIGYVTFMNLVFNCRLVITDSGGIQEESTYLGIPCLTLRPNTERPITITEGTNQLCTVDALVSCVDSIMNAEGEGYRKPELWDGRTAERVAASIHRLLGGQ
jgi:UDP-N-acetylglucosamine 2-epimerase (non-hydrolysing)